MKNEMTIEKQHNSVITEVFPNKSAYDKHEAQCAEYRPQYEKLIDILKQKTSFVRGKFGSFCPYLQFVWLDMLADKDWPNRIADNSVFIEFEINLFAKIIEIHRCGSIWLSNNDKKKSYLCMCSVKDAHKAQGGKWMRKTKYKSIDEAAEKIVKFYKSVHDNIETATGGYPFKQMKIDIY